MSATRNWTIAGAATVALGAVTGVAFATDGIDLQDRADAIQLASATTVRRRDRRRDRR